ncbi:MAG: ribonuclease III [Gammaproteobacteria bacterium]|nr:ribonuclease III [Gammaproteobacteria bacterium]
MTSAGAWADKQLGYKFSDPELLRRALTHKSRSSVNNERLEFLGDAVLDLVISAELHHAFPDADEGYLSRLRSRLVRGETLAGVATELGVGDIVELGSGESRSGGHQRRSILADALEALYGAIYLDGGFDAVRDVILEQFAGRLRELPDDDELKDPKTLLQEALQSRGFELPQYTVTRKSGPPHKRRFEVRCVVDEFNIETEGKGSSRRKAEQRAAEAVLRQIDTGDRHAS